MRRYTIGNRELDDWAYSFTEEVFDYWQNNFPEHKKGVKTFHSPVKKNPEFLILSYNPGWTKEDGEEDLEKYQSQEFYPPEKHEFIQRDYTMAERVRKLFENNLDLLENSVMHDLIFFRSNDVSELEDLLGEEKFAQVEDFCTEEVRKSIEKIDPEKILILGISSTYKLFKENVAPAYHEEKAISRKELVGGKMNRKSVVKGNWKGKEVYSIVHLSGAFGISNQEIREIRNEILN